MGKWKTVVDGYKFPVSELDEWVQSKDYTTDPSTAGWGAAEKGRLWLNTTSNRYKYWDGSQIVTIPAAGGGGGSAAKGAYTYLVYKSGSDYYAEDWEGNVVYGGPDDAGSVDGASYHAVISAVCNQFESGGSYPYGGTIFQRIGDYVLTDQVDVAPNWQSIRPYHLRIIGESMGGTKIQGSGLTGKSFFKFKPAAKGVQAPYWVTFANMGLEYGGSNANYVLESDWTKVYYDKLCFIGKTGYTPPADSYLIYYNYTGGGDTAWPTVMSNIQHRVLCDDVQCIFAWAENLLLDNIELELFTPYALGAGKYLMYLTGQFGHISHLYFAFTGGELDGVALYNRMYQLDIDHLNAGGGLAAGSTGSLLQCFTDRQIHIRNLYAVSFPDFGNISADATTRSNVKISGMFAWDGVASTMTPNFRYGVTSVADGGTIAHGVPCTIWGSSAPVGYGVTATAGGHIASVTAADATNLTIALKLHDGTPIAVAENVRWWATLT